MKLLISLFLITISLTAYSQSDDISDLVKITSSGLAEKQNVSYDSETSSLVVGSWIIPVSSNTFVKISKGNQVEFSLQKGTAVTSSEDSQLRKASFTLTFNSRKSAKEFINAFTKAST
jgi:hypothetical protein